MFRFRKVIALGLLLCGAGAHGEIYKCTDAGGAVQFTDHPCGSDATVISKMPSTPEAQGPDDHMQKTLRLLDAMKAEQEQAKQKKEQQKAAAEKRRRNCNNARDTLRNINEAGRLYRLDEQGRRVILSDQERTRAIDDTRARVAKWCN